MPLLISALVPNQHPQQVRASISNTRLNQSAHSARLIGVERTLLFALVAAAGLAVLGHLVFPLTPERTAHLLQRLGLHTHTGGHLFADIRSFMGVRNVADVLSNLSFLVFGVWGLGLLGLRRSQLDGLSTGLFGVFFVGLCLTTAGSMAYHWHPDDASLLWDRAGMAVAFAGVMGLAAAQRVSLRSGIWTAVLVLAAAALSLYIWRNTADVLPWVMVQFGGMALVIVLAFTSQRHIAGRGRINLWVLIAFYALAKVFESTDHAVFALTQQTVSGHSLKHIAASLAALPVIWGLKRAGN